MLQLESGFTYTTSGNERSFAIGELNFRWPLTRWFEVTAQAVSNVHSSVAGETAFGFTDSAVGCKIRLLEGSPTQAGTSPRIALLLLTSLPTGSRVFRSTMMQPQATLAVDLDITPSVSLSTNIGVINAADNEKRFDQTYGGLSFGFGLGGAWTAFLEGFAWQPGSASGTSQRVVDAGVQFLLSNDIMLDGRIGRSAGDGPPSTVTGFGLSLRW